MFQISTNMKGMEETHRKYDVLHKAINPFRTISPTDKCPPATEHTSNEEMMGILSKKGRVAKCNNHLGSFLLFLFLHVTLTLHVQLYNSMM